MAKKTVSMTFVVEPELRAAFVAAAQSADLSASQVLRAAMREYVEKNCQGHLPLKEGR